MVLSAPFLAMFAVSHEHRVQPDAHCEGLGVLGKISQLWPGRSELEPEFVLDAERKAFQSTSGKIC